MQPTLTDDEVRGDRRARPHDRAALRLAAGHRVGDRRRRHDLDAPVAAGHDGPRRRPSEPRRPTGAVLLRGLGAAPGEASGPVRVLGDARTTPATFADGEVLVTRMTSPDWVPLMRRAAAIATDSGGMTCHAAIVSRELGIPCVVGTQTATKTLRDGELVTVDATRGIVLEGATEAARQARRAPPRTFVTAASAATATQLLLNLSEPSQVERAAAPRRRRRRPAPRRADGARGARGHAPAAAARAGPDRRVRRPDGRRARRRSPPASRRARSPTGRSTSARTSSAASRAATASSPRRPTR